MQSPDLGYSHEALEKLAGIDFSKQEIRDGEVAKKPLFGRIVKVIGKTPSQQPDEIQAVADRMESTFVPGARAKPSLDHAIVFFKKAKEHLQELSNQEQSPEAQLTAKKAELKVCKTLLFLYDTMVKAGHMRSGGDQGVGIFKNPIHQEMESLERDIKKLSMATAPPPKPVTAEGQKAIKYMDDQLRQRAGNVGNHNVQKFIDIIDANDPSYVKGKPFKPSEYSIQISKFLMQQGIEASHLEKAAEIIGLNKHEDLANVILGTILVKNNPNKQLTKEDIITFAQKSTYNNAINQMLSTGRK